MKDLNKIVVEAIQGNKPVRETVNRILGEGISSGTTVAIVDDPITGLHGAKGVVKGESSKGSGFVEVQLENGTILPMQASLLVPV